MYFDIIIVPDHSGLDIEKVTDNITGVRCNVYNQLKDLGFAGDIRLLTEHRNYTHAKIDKLI